MSRIIAEIGANHMGDMDVAASMIRAAASVGVDVVKFQSWRADRLTKDWPDYDRAYAYYKQHELTEDDHRFLLDECSKNGVEFLTSVFDRDTVDMLAQLPLKRIKIPSPDANSWTLIDKCLNAFDEVIISTGMSNDEELNRLLGYIATKQMQYKTVIMHCVSEYPAPAKNMWRIKWLRDIGFRPGYSDHTLGTDAAKLAISMGAEYVEKHFTLSRFLPGKDQSMSGTIEEFEEICSWRDRVNDMVKMMPVEPKNLHYRGKYGDNT